MNDTCKVILCISVFIVSKYIRLLPPIDTRIKRPARLVSRVSSPGRSAQAGAGPRPLDPSQPQTDSARTPYVSTHVARESATQERVSLERGAIHAEGG